MARRKRLRRKKKIGNWRIRKSLNPPWSVLVRTEWGELPKEAFHPRGKSSSRK